MAIFATVVFSHTHLASAEPAARLAEDPKPKSTTVAPLSPSTLLETQGSALDEGAHDAPPGSNNDAANARKPEFQEQAPQSLQLNLGLQWWFVRDKAIFGPIVRFGGRWVTAHFEFSPIRLYRKSEYIESKWLGSISSFYLTLSPLKNERVEAHLGLGCEWHWLFGVNSEESKGAMGARASLHWWVGREWAVFGIVRTHLVASNGLGLGEMTSGARDLPMMISLGVEIGGRK